MPNYTTGEPIEPGDEVHIKNPVDVTGVVSFPVECGGTVNSGKVRYVSMQM